MKPVKSKSMTSQEKQMVKRSVDTGLKKYKKSLDALEQYDKKPEKAPNMVVDRRSLRDRIQSIAE